MARVPARLFLVGALLLCAACDSVLAPGPGEVVEDLFEALCSGDLESVSSHVAGGSSPMLQAGLPKAVSDCAAKGGLARVEIVGEKIVGDTATVKFKVHFGNGSVDDESGPNDGAKLVRIEGRWKLAMTK